MKKFEEFWAELHKSLDKPVSIKNWTKDRVRSGDKTFQAWSGKGTFAQNLEREGGVRLSPTAVYCGTLEAGNIRVLNKGEAKKIYELWPDYLDGNVPRSELRRVSTNLTYLLSIFHWFDHPTQQEIAR